MLEMWNYELLNDIAHLRTERSAVRDEVSYMHLDLGLILARLIYAML